VDKEITLGIVFQHLVQAVLASMVKFQVAVDGAAQVVKPVLTMQVVQEPMA
jgi:hypothetical protein